MDYTELTAAGSSAGSIRAWIADDTVPAERVLAEAEIWLAQRLRLRRMLARASGLLPAGSDTLELPPRCLEVQALYLRGHRGWQALRPLPAALLALEDGRAAPSGFAMLGDELLLDAPVAGAASWRCLYYAAPPPLSPLAPTNWLAAEQPQLLRAACLMLASEWRKDSAAAGWWQARTEALLRTLQTDENAGRAAAIPLPAADPALTCGGWR